MYKTIDISEIVGSTIYVKGDTSLITVRKLLKIISEIKANAPYVRIDKSRQAYIRLAELSMSKIRYDFKNSNCQLIPNDNEIKERFLLCYFQLDQDFRSTLEKTIKDILLK